VASRDRAQRRASKNPSANPTARGEAVSRLAAIALLALLAAWPVLAQEQGEKREQLMPRIRKTIEARCAAVSPTNERLQEKCMERQVEAAYEFIELSGRYPEGTEQWGILQRCRDRWVGPDGTKADFRMAVICVGIEVRQHETMR
jgi:hypothetical protein